MKISKLSLAVGLVTAMAIQSAQAGLPGTGYVGARLGYAFSTNDDLTVNDTVERAAAYYNSTYGTNYDTGDLADNKEKGWGLGLFGGYNFTDWFALECGLDYFTGFKLKAGGTLKRLGEDLSFSTDGSSDYKAWGPEIAARFAFTFDDKGSDIYLRAGLAYLIGDFEDFDDENKLSPFLGAGVQYAFTRNFSMRLGFDYYFNALEAKVKYQGDTYAKFESDLGFVYVGAAYTFGGSRTVPAMVTPQQVQKAHTLDAATLFPFNGDKLSAAGQQKVAEVVSDSRSFENVSYEVYGYTDRLGSDAYNQALSERRAAAVAAELRQNGVNEEALRVVEGRGKANPVTGDRCDNVGGRRALIDCLQPDRRVEVVVSGLQ